MSGRGGREFRETVGAGAGDGYARRPCGLMYLSRNLCVDEQIYPMVGVFPIDTVLERKPQGLGYIRVQVDEATPFIPKGPS